LVLRDTGQILLKDAQGDLGTLELNLHNSNWKYASQAEATAKCEEQAGGGKTFTGALMVPDVPGVSMSFLETITPKDDGVHVIYELRPSAPLVLNGLQISLLLPTARFAGQRVAIRGQDTPERSIQLPRVLDADAWQLGTVRGNTVEIGTEEAATLALRTDKTSGLILHDLRRWDREEFEIRIPIVQADEGKMIGANERFDVEVVLGPGEFEVIGP